MSPQRSGRQFRRAGQRPVTGKKPVKGPHWGDDYRTKTLQGVGALDSIGEGLRAAREAQGHTIQDVSLATRIRASYVEALEAEDFAALGGDVYTKGFLRSYASFLGLDPEPLVEAYRQRYAPDPSPGARLQNMRDTGMLATKEPRRRGWLPVGIGCVLAVLLLGVWSLVNGRGEPSSAPTVAAPETTPAPTTAAPTTTAPSTTGEVEVVLRFEGRSWASVTVDGARAFRGILSKGAQRSFKGKQAVDVALGNAGGVLLTVNGSDLGRAGPYGRTFQRTFTAQERAGADRAGTGQTSVTDRNGTSGNTSQYGEATSSTEASDSGDGSDTGGVDTTNRRTRRRTVSRDRVNSGTSDSDTEPSSPDDLSR